MVRVYCQPDKPKGRGKKVFSPPVKQLAEERGVPVSQPLKLKDGVVAAQLTEDNIDLALVVAYGRILPPAVFEAPTLDTWNVHASLLPKYRGASPIQHAILEGEIVTGVTLMQLRAGLDEGPMLLKKTLAIDPKDTAGTLTERLAQLGSSAVVEGLERAKTEGLEVVEQNGDEATFAPLIQKADGELRFEEAATHLALRVRGFDPWPGTYVQSKEGPIKVLSVQVFPTNEKGEPGTIHSLDPLRIWTGDGALEITRLQAPGRKPIMSADYVRGAGRHLKVGQPFAQS